MFAINQTPLNFNDFLLQNRKYINSCVLRIIALCIFTGPAIAAGIYFGVFKSTSYIACVNISVAMILLFILCTYLYKKQPYSIVSSMVGITAMNFLLVYMTIEHINISITWYLMPLLSMLLLDTKIYLLSLGVNYVMSLLALYLTSSGDDSFATILGGRTIETIIMGIVGLEIGRLIAFYYKSLISEKENVSNTEAKMQKQFTLLESMTDLYDKVNFLDFENMTEESLQGEQRASFQLDFNKSNHSTMVNNLSKQISPVYLKRFLEFTDLCTVQKRLKDKNIIYIEFTNKTHEWYRAQYINVDVNEDNLPQKVIFTVLNIDEEKKKEDQLLQLALTDELTHLYNRRCYEEDIAELNKRALPMNVGIFSVDVNGLKIANDTLGHYAGDELINGAAKCILTAIGDHGKVYRTGGDEFIAIVFTYDFPAIEQSLISNMLAWHGQYIHELTLSYGYATIAEFPDASIYDLAKIADRNMYINKENFYKERGIDRNKLYENFGK